MSDPDAAPGFVLMLSYRCITVIAILVTRVLVRSLVSQGTQTLVRAISRD